MEYCVSGADGTASIWNRPSDLDLDGDGTFDAVGLDLDGDGLRDDALLDLDHDGTADHAVLDVDNDGIPESYFVDDGSGTWTVAVDRQVRWFGLDGVEHSGGPLVDFDGQGEPNDRLVDSDGDGLADQVVCTGPAGVTGYVDTDGDGRWDIRLSDSDGDGSADGAAAV
ncbi:MULTISPECIES: pullulanase [Mycobacterium]|uniref:Pullulanase n=1 Tax=Mycobacterium kiyosense TaxID=2871094 RepID=A0A9P3UX39_9MYCO|nr:MULTISPECIES: pullulanase [Mycobacterium]BDB45799.1 hypothetical protein IWGMT90018_62450 [Mycobacterium kiyosense]BDE11406.1 hypothetical protein MKCMC460_02660 [Mycobacterium sp. 20KCMC460]GLB86717.1 hypothetical protein SRL2020028_59730 [Mycobacterium kiyosense]GLB93103.1 hypothetical protein SRL2020130_59200 [Mycobacterium kiyosense]GLB98395.1 hypothetical protein SRL2020226_51710 [Mycobacterium kiyosense]